MNLSLKMTLPMRMFVYGTLLEGFSNHFLLSNCKKIGAAKTISKFGLFISDYPMVTSKISESNIIGEVYEVGDEQSLKDLDELEGHPDWYYRVPTEVELLATQERFSAQIYFQDTQDFSLAEKVPTGSFKDSPTSAKYLVTAEVLVN